MLLVEGTSARVVTSEELGLESWDMASWNWMNTYVLPFCRAIRATIKRKSRRTECA